MVRYYWILYIVQNLYIVCGVVNFIAYLIAYLIYEYLKTLFQSLINFMTLLILLIPVKC
jgi:hypothetical protein